jgi:hypothetical protein
MVREGCRRRAGPVRSGECVRQCSGRSASQRPERQRSVLIPRGFHGQRVGCGLDHERRRGAIEAAPGSSRLDRRRGPRPRLRSGGALAAAVLGRRATHRTGARVPTQGERELGREDPHEQHQRCYRCGPVALQPIEAGGHGRPKIRGIKIPTAGKNGLFWSFGSRFIARQTVPEEDGTSSAWYRVE